MAAIVSTEVQISILFPQRAEIYDAIAGEAITAGQAVYFNSSGKIIKSNAGAAGTAKFAGIALNTAGAGQAVSVLVRGHIAGYTLSGAYGSKAYLSDTAGALADAAGTVSVVAGSVVPLSDASRTKVLYVNSSWLAL